MKDFCKTTEKRHIPKTFGINFGIYSTKTAFNKAEENNTFRGLHNSSNHTKDESNNFFIIHPRNL